MSFCGIVVLTTLNPKPSILIREYASGGELVDLIATKHSLSEKEARVLFRQLISAMDHCHLASVVHRDLKLENLLLDSNKNLLVSDFGLGRTFSNTKELLNTFCGTPNYAAVELITYVRAFHTTFRKVEKSKCYFLISGTPYVGTRSDIWAMGVILVRFPFFFLLSFDLYEIKLKMRRFVIST